MDDDPIVQQPSAFRVRIYNIKHNALHITMYYYYHNGPSDKNNCVRMYSSIVVITARIIIIIIICVSSIGVVRETVTISYKRAKTSCVCIARPRRYVRRVLFFRPPEETTLHFDFICMQYYYARVFIYLYRQRICACARVYKNIWGNPSRQKYIRWKVFLFSFSTRRRSSRKLFRETSLIN